MLTSDNDDSLPDMPKGISYIYEIKLHKVGLNKKV